MRKRAPLPANARAAAARAIARQVRRYPEVNADQPETFGLSDADTRFATSIYRETMRRWLTLDWVLRRNLRQRPSKLEPAIHAVLLTGAAQILFLEGIPVHAAVDESVELSKRISRPAAGALVNTVLRGVAQLPSQREPDARFEPSVHALPLAPRGVLRLTQPILPALKTFDEYLSIATSHPAGLVRRWIDLFGRGRAMELLLHDLQEPPTIVFNPTGVESGNTRRHEAAGFFLWMGRSGELPGELEKTGGWVQDPAAHRAVEATRGLSPSLILDYCAGRGTKTFQLRVLHPDARIVASDPDPVRHADLVSRFQSMPWVATPRHAQLPDEKADLLVLDVPCSNSGVFARRVEARYRSGDESRLSLIRLQREIVNAAAPRLKEGGRLLYSTCSIDPTENEEQAAWIGREHGLRMEKQETTLPAGCGCTYHDGGYYALMRRYAA